MNNADSLSTLTSHSTFSTRIMPAEWECQDAVVLAWPHSDTDWAPILDEVQECYRQVATAIARDQRLIIVTPNVAQAQEQLRHIDNGNNIIYLDIDTNDTWARDFAPIAVIEGEKKLLLDFKFNAWGLKFAACLDNLISQKMAQAGIFEASLVNCQDFVLEGGSIESDGNGTLLTTSECLLSPNRNGSLTAHDIENVLTTHLGAKKILWLNHGGLIGDDTDAHIDTLARLAPGNTIVYVKSDDASDPQHKELKLMEQELKTLSNANDEPFNLVALPCPTPIVDEDGARLPATYANFLITNHQVLVPTYGQPSNDEQALATIARVFPNRTITGIDCNALIKQHGSLHCITMQIPHKFLKT